MAIEFDHPLWLLAASVPLALAIIESASRSRTARPGIAARMLAGVLLVVALAGPYTLDARSAPVHRLWLFAGALGEQLTRTLLTERLTAEVRALAPQDRLTLFLAQPDGAPPLQLAEWRGRSDPTDTLARALDRWASARAGPLDPDQILAIAAHGEARQDHGVEITCFYQASDPTEDAAWSGVREALDRAGVSLAVNRLLVSGGGAWRLLNLRPSRPPRQGEPTELAVLVDSDGPEGVAVRLALEVDGTVVSEIEGRVEPEPSTLVFPPVFLDEGRRRLRVAGVGGGPAIELQLVVAAPPKAVIVSRGETMALLREALTAAGYACATVPSWREVDLPCDLLALDSDVKGAPAAGLADRLRRAIEDGRTHLLGLGGPDGGLAELRGSALAAVLPVEILGSGEPAGGGDEVAPTGADDVKEKPPVAPPLEPPEPDALEAEEREAGTVTLLLVLDRSGSMSRDRKMDIVREAALASAQALDASDRVGIIAFDEDAELILSPVPARHLDLVRAAIAGVHARDKGTLFKPAFLLALNVLREDPASVRHVIFLSDGAPNHYEGYESLIRILREEQITISTVGVGNDHVKKLMAQIGYVWGGGKYHPALDPRQVPYYFTIETRRITAQARDEGRKEPAPPAEEESPEPEPPEAREPEGTDESEGEAPPAEEPEAPPARARVRIIDPSFLSRSLDPTRLPEVAGYVPTRARRWATVVFGAGAEGTPILSYGPSSLGRVAVWTSGLSGRWGAEWGGWEDLGMLTDRLLRWLTPAYEPPLSVGWDWIGTACVIEMEGADSMARPVVEVAFPEGGGQELIPWKTDPGRWAAALPISPERRGGLTVRVSSSRDGEWEPVEMFLTPPARAGSESGPVTVIPEVVPSGRHRAERRVPLAPWLLGVVALVMALDLAWELARTRRPRYPWGDAQFPQAG